MRVVVIGAGIVGASTAVELLRDGHDVTIVEPDTPGGRQAASYGNSGWLSPASVVPMSMPGLWKKVPGFIADPTGPLAIRWRYLLGLAPWLARFVAAGSSVSKVERTAAILSSLLYDCPERHTTLAEEIGRPELIVRKGLIYAYADRAAFLQEALAWRLRAQNDVAFRELSAQELAALEPDLSPRYTFAVLVEKGGHCLDPGGYVGAIAAHAVAKGAERVTSRATGFDVVNGRLRAVLTEDGPLPCDRAVIATGIRSKSLAAAVGDDVPLQSERGYHVVIPPDIARGAMPVMPADGKMGNNPMLAGLRIAGQVELASPDAAPDWSRADILLGHAKRAYGALSKPFDESRIDRWMGHRPSMADGLPVIGKARSCADIIHAFGHGHIGLASGPATARIVADLIGDKALHIDVAPLSATRF
ncbi:MULTISPECIES: FAD-binding oxidoreductase [unclassified Beijerinckia]|uniref:NAD(P)/FAD-dependent oxidoreductase n=1 Tax=unclassified Beijerinckia TaxID=2638183 RepID=UPI00089C9DFC|nr:MULTISPECIES: FAD-binding oxidoreductase [unclassified Beijerinckia]MDH7797095.1 D-amino-acid dehydrogenase [Beijerinckia sp. GAS462]SEC72033.1 D-amino-acid dehydrogenase [Beijerinckia sp. 28-YEA-48]